MPKLSLKRASFELARLDPVMERLVGRHGPVKFDWGTKREWFVALARAICFQQLAGAAASAIWRRFEESFDGVPTPRSVLRKRVPTLRACGLSAGKIASIRDLASKFDGGAIEVERFPRLADDEIVRQLCEVRGIGPWTAQMFLIFQLDRQDVWPVLDYGVRKGFAIAYGLGEMPTPKQLEPEGDRFKPFRSLAAWYCWRATEAGDDP